jgi:hypothetical protein
MSEEKTIQQLEKELAKARAMAHNEITNRVTRSRDLDAVGIDASKTVEKKIPSSSDIPDVILLPKKQRRSENKW